MAKDVGLHGGMHDTGRGWGNALFHAAMALGRWLWEGWRVYFDAQWSKDGIQLFIDDDIASWAVTLLYNTFGQFVVSSMLSSQEFSSKLSPKMRKMLRGGIVGSYIFDTATNLVTFYAMLGKSARMTQASWWIMAIVVIPTFGILITFSEWVLSLCFQYLISSAGLLFDLLDDGQVNGSNRGTPPVPPKPQPQPQPKPQPNMKPDENLIRERLAQRMAEHSANKGERRDADGLIIPNIKR